MALAMDNGHHALVEFLLKATSTSRGQPAYTPLQNQAQVRSPTALLDLDKEEQTLPAGVRDRAGERERADG